MAKSISDLVRNVKSGVGGMGKYLSSGIGKYAAITAVGIASYLGTPSQVYADKFVNNSMTYIEINNETASATPGESVHFAEGTYQLPQIQTTN